MNAEMNQLYRAVTEAAQTNPGPEIEAAALAIFREAPMPWCCACKSYHSTLNPTCYLKTGFPEHMRPEEIELRRVQAQAAEAKPCYDCKTPGVWGPLGRCQPCYIRLMDDYKEKARS